MWLLLIFTCSSSLEADSPSINFAQTTSATQSNFSEVIATASATGRSTASGPEYPDVYGDSRTANTLSDSEKTCLLEGKWESSDLHKYIFPSRYAPELT